MAKVLSQDEIDQLLSVFVNTNIEPEDFKPTMYDKKTRKYNFKRPDKFSKEQISIISIIHETFSHLTSYSFSAQLRSMVQINVASVDQITYEEFIRSIPTPTTLAVINMKPLKRNIFMEIDPDISSSIIDRICGGIGCGSVIKIQHDLTIIEKPINVIKFQHELTIIEKSIMGNIITGMLENMREAWSTFIDIHPHLETINTNNPQSFQFIPPKEMVIDVMLETQIGDVKGIINICIPYLTVEPIIEKLSNCFLFGKNQINKPITKLSNLKIREDIPVRLTAEILYRDYPIKEINNWNTETLILPLRQLSPGYCYLRLGDRRVWQCQILPDNKCFAKRIKIVNYAEKPFGTEGNDMKTEECNSPAAEALSNAMMKVSVELGSTLKTVKEVFALAEGTILELDKLAGEPVDVKANGVLIAYGEVVVIDENFGIRITEIAGTNEELSKEIPKETT
jgi:flagellar motor switch protein FliM